MEIIISNRFKAQEPQVTGKTLINRNLGDKDETYVSTLMVLVVMLSMTSCGDQASENEQDKKWSAYKNFYTTSIQYTGENDSTQKYLEIAERSAKLLSLLEKNHSKKLPS